jgi:exopolysaccharide biosynthesis WecB/TagA/CpsF family protein
VYSKVDLKFLKVDVIKCELMTELIKKSNLEKEIKIVLTPNASHLKNIMNSDKMNKIYNSADFNLIDGWPIAVATSIKLRKKIPRLTGSDLIPKLFGELDSSIRIGIIGGNNESKTRKIIESLFPHLNLQLVNCDYWTDSKCELEKLKQLVQHNALSIVILALGHPKQEKIAHALKNCDWFGFRPNWILCVGASIDFITNNQKRAPIFIQKIGFEWCYRLLKNPSRFLKRYVQAIIPSIKLIIRSTYF